MEKKLSLDEGAILTMKYAELFDIHIGDELTFYDKDQNSCNSEGSWHR
jgi:putative ABC transport system permease protein